MYLENGDEVIEADNGKLILSNSGAYCDEYGNPTGGCIDDEPSSENLYDYSVYITKYGKTYHKSPKCTCIKDNKSIQEISISKVGNRKPCKRCYK